MKTFIFILFCTISSSALAARIAVVYHSGYGHTEVIAKAVYKGTLEIKGTESKLIIQKYFLNKNGKIRLLEVLLIVEA